MVFETEADGTGKSQPFEIKTEDTTERDEMLAPYLCTVCDKRFTMKSALTRHRQVHNVESVYSCSECETSFSTQSASRWHQNIHTAQKYSCTQCQKYLLSQHSLSQHKNIHTGKYKCTECGRCFTTQYQLEKHMLKLHPQQFNACKYVTHVMFHHFYRAAWNAAAV